MKNRLWMWGVLLSGCVAGMNAAISAEDEFDSGISARETQIAIALSSLGTALNLKPLPPGFFVSGAAVTSKMSPNVNPAGSTADLHSLTPYLAMGWSSRKIRKKGWGLVGDVGVLFRGRTTLSLTNASCILGNVGAVSVCQGFDYGSAGPVLNDGRNNVMRYVPILRAGIRYLF